jgi:hypothetical protein
MQKIEVKSWKSGTYAITTYYKDGEEFHTTNEKQIDCGVSWFNELPESEEEAVKEDITGNTPTWFDELLKGA